MAEDHLTSRMEFADLADYWSLYPGGQGPAGIQVRALEPAARERLMEHVRRAYLDGEPDGPRCYACTAWAVRGRVPG